MPSQGARKMAVRWPWWRRITRCWSRRFASRPPRRFSRTPRTHAEYSDLGGGAQNFDQLHPSGRGHRLEFRADAGQLLLIAGADDLDETSAVPAAAFGLVQRLVD